jgi:hypothetical protein
MLSIPPRALATPEYPDERASALLDAPPSLVERYLELTRARRAIEDQLAYVRGELELIAAASLNDASPRGRFAGARGGVVAARIMPTCSFDRLAVGRELQRMGRLHEVAVLQGPNLARYLAKEPVVAARLGEMIRHRRTVMLMAGSG